ncbi:hypothetical protein [Flavobacterium suzhouense]|uniref:Tic20 family protein n=1 Tax=Flavobacterium suzhouense TaxID=1529638 RepID=A0ABW5NXU1_9FLAO
MEYTEGTIETTPVTETKPFVHPYEYELASNSYMMAVVSVIAGLPLPVINLIATVGYYLAHRKSSYLVRWHCIQASLGQIALIPFNSIALAWTLGILFGGRGFLGLYDIPRRYYADNVTLFEDYTGTTLLYWLYITFVIILNITEFIIVIATATKVRKGHNVRWFGIASLADRLTSTEDRNPYKTA